METKINAVVDFQNKFSDYLHQFETRIMVAGFVSGVFQKRFNVSNRSGKLDNTEYGKAVGTVLTGVPFPIVLDFYGLLKKSTGFYESISKLSAGKPSTVVVNVPIVHFAAIRLDVIVDLAKDLVFEFPAFKRYLLQMRGFSYRGLETNAEDSN